MTHREIKNWDAVYWAIALALCGVVFGLLCLMGLHGSDKWATAVVLFFFGLVATVVWSDRFKDAELYELRGTVSRLYKDVSDPEFMKENSGAADIFTMAREVNEERLHLLSSEPGHYSKEHLRALIARLEPLATMAREQRDAKAREARNAFFSVAPNDVAA